MKFALLAVLSTIAFNSFAASDSKLCELPAKKAAAALIQLSHPKAVVNAEKSSAVLTGSQSYAEGVTLLTYMVKVSGDPLAGRPFEVSLAKEKAGNCDVESVRVDVEGAESPRASVPSTDHACDALAIQGTKAIIRIGHPYAVLDLKGDKVIDLGTTEYEEGIKSRALDIMLKGDPVQGNFKVHLEQEGKSCELTAIFRDANG